MKKVLITGVAGFVGSNLADRLIKDGGYEIIGIDNLSYGIKEQIPEEVKFYEIDIRDESIFCLFKNVDYVFHFAAKNCINACQLDPIETFDINVTGTANVFEAAKENNIKKIIYAESSAIYEESEIFPTPETEVNPRSFYALSKASSMLVAKGYSRFHNLNSTALRYFCVYGPRQDYRRSMPPLFSSFIIKILKGEQPIIYGDGDKRRDFIYIDDINDFHIQCMNDERTDNQVFNLGCGINYPVNFIYYEIANLLNSKIRPVYEADLPGEAIQNLADISKAQKLGWNPKISLQEGLKYSIEYIKNEIKNGNI